MIHRARWWSSFFRVFESRGMPFYYYYVPHKWNFSFYKRGWWRAWIFILTFSRSNEWFLCQYSMLGQLVCSVNILFILSVLFDSKTALLIMLLFYYFCAVSFLSRNMDGIVINVFAISVLLFKWRNLRKLALLSSTFQSCVCSNLQYFWHFYISHWVKA